MTKPVLVRSGGGEAGAGLGAGGLRGAVEVRVMQADKARGSNKAIKRIP